MAVNSGADGQTFSKQTRPEGYVTMEVILYLCKHMVKGKKK